MNDPESTHVGFKSPRQSPTQKHITNLPSRADLFAATVNQYLGYVNTSGNMSPPTAQRLSAIFGVYGELPLVAVRLDDGFVLMDPLAGNLSGPFAPDSVLDARGLLSAYEGNGVYQPGTGVRYLTTAGCPTVAAAGWHNNPPCPWYAPACSYPIAYPTPAGSWHCSEYGIDGNGAVACVCQYDGTGTGSGTPATVPVRRVCRCGIGGSGCGGSYPAGTGSPPAAPAGCTGACTDQYFW